MYKYEKGNSSKHISIMSNHKAEASCITGKIQLCKIKKKKKGEMQIYQMGVTMAQLIGHLRNPGLVVRFPPILSLDKTVNPVPSVL